MTATNTTLLEEIKRYAETILSGEFHPTLATDAILRSLLPPYKPVHRIPRILDCEHSVGLAPDGGGGTSRYAFLHLEVVAGCDKLTDLISPALLAERLLTAAVAARLTGHPFTLAQDLVFKAILTRPQPTNIPRIDRTAVATREVRDVYGQVLQRPVAQISFIVSKTRSYSATGNPASDAVDQIREHYIKGKPVRP